MELLRLGVAGCIWCCWAAVPPPIALLAGEADRSRPERTGAKADWKGGVWVSRAERAARTRELVMRAGAEVFAEEGFVSARVGVISRRAGVTPGAFHFHFANKQTLARAVEAAALVALHRITRKAGEEYEGALRQLVGAGHGLMRALEEDVVVRAGFQLVGPAPWRTEPLDLRGAWQGWVEALLGTARREGTLADGVSPTGASSTVIAATVGLAALGMKESRWLSQEALSQYWDVMLPCLASDPEEPVVP
ncbi:ScbR family autoregulator-binding transcription factor [Streptomyces sp. NPDC005562]|uniref:ScbR family autoregulator-binding transcription factor n=1 Tax=Streptomyces sp. NPDC005562 TaxID=3154890 RepID=UPI0033B0679F